MMHKESISLAYRVIVIVLQINRLYHMEVVLHVSDTYIHSHVRLEGGYVYRIHDRTFLT